MRKGNGLLDSIEDLIGDCDQFKRSNNGTSYRWNLNDMEQKNVDFTFSAIDKIVRAHQPVLVQFQNATKSCPAYVTVEIPVGY